MMPNQGYLDDMIREAKQALENMTPSERQAMHVQQRQGWAYAELSWPKPKFKLVDGVKVYDSYKDYIND